MYDFNNVVDFDEYRLQKKLATCISGSIEHRVVSAVIDLYTSGAVGIHFEGDDLMVQATSGSCDIYKHMPHE